MPSLPELVEEKLREKGILVIKCKQCGNNQQYNKHEGKIPIRPKTTCKNCGKTIYIKKELLNKETIKDNKNLSLRELALKKQKELDNKSLSLSDLIKEKQKELYSFKENRRYFERKLNKYDGMARDFMLVDGMNAFDRYRELSTTNNPIWIKGKKCKYIYESIQIGLPMCPICREYVIWSESLLHHSIYDFYYIFTKSNIIHKGCHQKGNEKNWGLIST